MNFYYFLLIFIINYLYTINFYFIGNQYNHEKILIVYNNFDFLILSFLCFFKEMRGFNIFIKIIITLFLNTGIIIS